jgi:CRISPR system Cascade subunit CasA
LRYLSGLVVCLLGGCVAYHPAPPDPDQLVRRASADAIDESAVRETLARIAPGDAWDGVHWDRLALFAAAASQNSRIAQTQATVASAVARADASRTATGPTLTLVSEYSRDADGSSPWLLGLASEFPLDIGGRRESRVTAADIDVRIARLDFAQVLWNVRLELRRALSRYLVAEREIGVAKSLATLRTRQIELTERFVAAGELPGTELERVRSDQDADARRLNDAVGRAAAATVALGAAIGVEPDAVPVDRLVWLAFDEPRHFAIDAIAGQRDQAILSRSDVLRALAAYDQAENELSLAVAQQYPEIHVGPGYTWERGIVKIPFSLGLSLPNFDLNRGAIRAAEASRREASRDLDATVAAAQTEISTAVAGYESAWSLLTTLRTQAVPTATALARRADADLAAGAIGRADWIAAQTGELAARLDLLDAIDRVRDAEADIENALRRPIDGPELAILHPVPTSDIR